MLKMLLIEQKCEEVLNKIKAYLPVYTFAGRDQK